MRIWDVMKLALHNLRCNKTRTILTVIIISVVSALIMTISLLGIFLFENQINIEKAIFDKNGTEYFMSDMAEEEYFKYIKIVEKYDYVVDTMTVDLNSSYKNNYSYFLEGEFSDTDTDSNLEYEEIIGNAKCFNFDFNVIAFTHFGLYSLNADNLISEGRMWNVSDNGKNGIWLSSAMLKNMAKEDIYLKTGDVITLSVKDESEYNSYKLIPLNIMGIYREDVMQKVSDSPYEVPWAVMSADTVIGPLSEMCEIYGVDMKYYPPEGDYDYGVIYKAMENMTNEINGALKYSVNSDKKTDRFVCVYVMDMQIAVLVNSIYRGIIFFMAFIVLLLCVGSVANTIIMSVDKDRKFFGLMKALGLNEKGLNNIVFCQSVLLVMTGVAVGIIVLFFIQPVILSLVSSMCSQLIASYSVNYTVYVFVPIYLPFITAAAFFVFAMIFARSSLIKLVRQDAISTINEVA